jgi:hypothetical protein
VARVVVRELARIAREVDEEDRKVEAEKTAAEELKKETKRRLEKEAEEGGEGNQAKDEL